MNIRKILSLLALGIFALPALAGNAERESAKHVTPNYELAERFSLDRLRRMVYTTSTRPMWMHDGERFIYRWNSSEGGNYYLADPARGSVTPVFDLDKLAMRLTSIVRDPFDAAHIPFSDFRVDEQDDSYVRFDIRSTAERSDTSKGPNARPEKIVYRFRYNLNNAELTYTTDKKDERYPEWANVSPDGLTGIYVKGFDLYYMDTLNLHKAAKDPKDTTIVEHRITFDGTKEWCYASDNYRGCTQTDTTERRFPQELVWSPDSRHFAVMRWDMSPVKELWVINSLSQPRPTLETYKYQMPGEPGPKCFLYMFETETWKGRQIKCNAFKDQEFGFERPEPRLEDTFTPYYSNRWLGDENGFYALRQSRDLKRMDLCYVGVDADSTRTVISERMNTYVEGRNHRLLNSGKQILHWSERNGWANIYLYNSDGSLVRNLTEGAFHVEDILAVNEKESYILISACGKEKGENPYQMHTYRVSLKDGSCKLLDMPDMNVDAIPTYSGKYFIANYSRVDYKPASALYDANGKRICTLGEADFSQLFQSGYKFPERFKVKAADGITDLYGVLYKPYDFDSTKVYPICDYVYPGPQVEANKVSWTIGFTRTERLAQLGFIVVTVGNRGGHPDRSKWYHNYGYGNLRDYGLADQKYAIQQLGARYSWIDLDRVGIHGHSGGGFMSTAAILQYPDFFKVAVSCAGNHDNSIYNRWWSEQHHGIKEIVAASDTTFAYSIETNPEIASRLKGHLLLVTGDVDNNVHPANTIRVVNALIKANKRFDMLVLPGQSHSFGQMDEYFFWRMADYYCEWLLGDSRRSVVDISQINNR